MSITAESNLIQQSQAAAGKLPALKQSEKLNLGCGPNAPSTWLNLDGSWNAWFSNHPNLRKALETFGVITKTNKGAVWNVRPLVHDLRKPLPFKENTLGAIYASHVFEHLFRADALQLLSECRRVLRAGGVIRLVVPDLYSMVVDYLQRKNGENNPDKTTAADYLNERLGFRSPDPPMGNAFFKFYSVWKDFHSHKWMYDSDSLIRCLERAGFQEVAEKEFLVSDISGIEEVEDPGRVLDGAGICVEGRKP
jgi:SAM-dependent methyltransferase